MCCEYRKRVPDHRVFGIYAKKWSIELRKNSIDHFLSQWGRPLLLQAAGKTISCSSQWRVSIPHWDKRSARMRRDSVWKMSAYADPNPAPILASENWIKNASVFLPRRARRVSAFHCARLRSAGWKSRGMCEGELRFPEALVLQTRDVNHGELSLNANCFCIFSVPCTMKYFFLFGILSTCAP